MGKNNPVFVGDFETTVYKGQVRTEVWASACVELYTENVMIFNSIEQQFEYFKSLNKSIIIYYHNLKFDGNFWLSFLINDLHLEQAYYGELEDYSNITWCDKKYMKNNTFSYMISSMGQWYTITIKINNHFIEIRDSLKLLPFSVSRIGKSFATKHKKLDMEYEGFRYAGCEITDEEKKYISNDVLVVKEALEIMFNENHTKLTIGSCCLSEFKSIYGVDDYNMFFPDLSGIELDKDIYECNTVDEYIRKSYKGGWCYLVKGKENKQFKNGVTADVNSLYPSMMSSESGNRYPVGLPKFWNGNFIPDDAIAENKYFFIRIKTRFYIKNNMLPFVQLKGNIHYKSTEMLETSDIYNSETKKYDRYYLNFDNKVTDTDVTMTLTMTDYYLLLKHYELVDYEILDGCYFYSEIGIFDEYIEKYKKMKLVSKDALRELAKLFLNNLYGKLSSSTNSSFKIAYVKDDLSLGFITVLEHNKKAGYIPCGSAITSYARNFTISSAQENYYGADKSGFIYADTDSIHCDLPPSKIKGIKVHDKNFCCWKLESSWDVGLFVRQKTYIEHVTEENLEKIDKPYYNIKCAGMPQKCKDLFELSMSGYEIKENDTFTDEEIKFLSKKRELSDFKKGLKVPSKLIPKRINGGVLLKTTSYEMR